PGSLPPTTTTCHAAPWWHLGNAAHGRQYEVDYYDKDGTTLLTKTATTLQAICPPSGVSGSPANGYGHWNGMLVSELDGANPVGVCDVRASQTVTTTNNATASIVTDTEAYTYDSYGRVTQTTSTSNSGTPTQVVNKTTYVWNDGLIVPPPASGSYS